jgi:TonB-dependent siderophore receptor
MLLMSLAWAAPDASPRYGLSIRAGLALDEALQELAHQTGIQIVFFSKITAGRRAPELSGEYTFAAALTRLLKGSDLTFRQINERTVEVQQAAPPSVRPPPKLQQPPPTPASDDPMQEVHVVATAEQLVATRVPTPLQEIPQSISIISSEQIREQNSFDLGDVMERIPGIAVRRSSSVDETIYSRAFQVTSYHVDGGGALSPSINNVSLYQGNPDLSEYDHLEVLRGSDALFSGNSDPGGTVSLVRKRPLSTPSYLMSTTLGSWNNYRVELDATGPLTDDGALRARTDIVYATRDYFFDRAHLDRKKLFAVIEYDVTPRGTLTAGATYQWDNSLPLETPALVNDDGSPAHLPLSTGLTFPWAFYNTRIGDVYAQYRQQFAPDWMLKVNTSAGRTIVDYGYGAFAGKLNANGGLGSPSASFSTRPQQFTLGTADATLTGKARWLGLREALAFGVDFTRLSASQNEEDYFGFGPPLQNIFSFNPQAYPDPRGAGSSGLTSDAQAVVEQYGGFALFQVDPTDALSLSIGARVATDTFRLSGTVSIGALTTPEVSEELGNSHVVQPYGALLYRLTHHLSWYASYADIYRTLYEPYLGSNGEPLGPQHGVTFESGLKGAWRDGALNGSLAIYRVEQRDVPVQTGASSAIPDCCYTTGAGRSRGAELEVDGELAPGWLIGSGYAYNLYRTGDGSFPSDATPHHQLKVWMSVRLPGAFSRWTLGGTLRAQTASPGTMVEDCNAQYQNCVPAVDVGTRPYVVVDLRAGFRLNTNWQIALSVNNILDKRYYLSQNTADESLWFGDPRNFMVRIDAKY